MTTCSGITARPLDVKQVSLEAARQVVPDSLYWLIRFLVTGEAGKTNCPSQCSNTSNERQILSICQDIIHCSTNGRVKTPKHAGLAITVHHLTSSRRLITLLNKMGYCSSYDEMRAIDTSAALEVLAKANEFGTVIPSNISPGPFIQITADNNDLNKETLDGKNTTHATTWWYIRERHLVPICSQRHWWITPPSEGLCSQRPVFMTYRSAMLTDEGPRYLHT